MNQAIDSDRDRSRPVRCPATIGCEAVSRSVAVGQIGGTATAVAGPSNYQKPAPYAGT